jgi:hypothetical protein
MIRLMSALAYDAPKMSAKTTRNGKSRRIGQFMLQARGTLKSQRPVW